MVRGRRVVAIAAVCLVMTAAAIAYAAAKTSAPEVIQAQRFELVNAEGEVRAVLGLLLADKPSLVLNDEKGTLLAMLCVGFDGSPGLALYDEKGTMRVGVSLMLGSPLITLYDEEGTGRAGLSLFPDGSPSITLHDEKGKVRAALGTTSLEATRTGAMEKRAESSLVLFDKDGKVLGEAP